MSEQSGPSLLIMNPQRGRGRPPAEMPGSSITAWVPVDLHDKLIAMAGKNGESVSATIRTLLTLKLK